MTTAEYLKQIEKALRKGTATEHTHRPALKALLEGRKKGLSATNEPKAIKCGAPDFIVERGSAPIGYVEAKDVGAPLDKTEKTEQLVRYREALPNLILTDYLEFRWYVRGERKLAAKLATADAKGNLTLSAAGITDGEALLDAFLAASLPVLSRPQDLAARMARLARLIRSLIVSAFGDEGEVGALHGLLEGFRKVLISDLTGEQFADMYAQTICYGLFAARCNHDPEAGRFTREAAGFELPKTNPFLREIFNQIAGPGLDERLIWAVEDLANVLDRTDIGAILKDFGHSTLQKDPVVHFYETFLAQYDAKLRETRGVYYTPEPVVSYIVRSVDELLKNHFHLGDGLADNGTFTLKAPVAKGKKTTASSEHHRVLILDPAVGTGTFLHSIIDLVHETVKAKGMGGAWSAYVSQHLLPRLFGFELLMAPYAVCHMKLGLQLTELGYDFKAAERLRVYLTNSLEEAHALAGLPLFATALANEANEASEIKLNKPVMVVLGNPPYSGHSANKGPWIAELLNAYKKDIPELKKPAQAKWLSDDYVKFFRFAQWRIEQTGYGILAFITNHGYLDNPTFRGMRKSLMETFEHMYVLDLHGNSKKKEKAPDGSADENVFDIQQGVAIGIFIRRGPKKPGTVATVRHAHLWGMRSDELGGGKYPWLAENSVSTTAWTEIAPQAPNYLFIPQDAALLANYSKGWRIPDIFSVNGDPAPGIVTTHDEFAISWSKDEAIHKVGRLLATESEAEARGIFKLCGQDQWDYERAKKELKDGAYKALAQPILYRPFDLRWTIYDRNVAVHRRERVSRHMISGSNLALVTSRSVEIGRGFEHVFVSRHLVHLHAVSLKEVNFLFPLYLGSTSPGAALLKSPNVAPEFAHTLEKALDRTFRPDGPGDGVTSFGPEDILHYVYAVLHSQLFRVRYSEFLRSDFPRVPLPSTGENFWKLAKCGKRLIALHLMETQAATLPAFPIKGSNEIEKIRYVSSAGKTPGRVWINSSQYFEGISPETWEFHIGGYRVAERWLKDRTGQTLGFELINRYRWIVGALAESRGEIERIDGMINSLGGLSKAFA